MYKGDIDNDMPFMLPYILNNLSANYVPKKPQYRH